MLTKWITAIVLFGTPLASMASPPAGAPGRSALPESEQCLPGQNASLRFIAPPDLVRSLISYDIELAYAVYALSKLSQQGEGLDATGAELVAAAVPTPDELTRAIEGGRLERQAGVVDEVREQRRFRLVAEPAADPQLVRLRITKGSDQPAAASVTLDLAPSPGRQELRLVRWSPGRMAGTEAAGPDLMRPAAPIVLLVSEAQLEQVARANPMASMIMANMAGLQEMAPGTSPRSGKSISSRGVTAESAAIRRRRTASAQEIFASTYELPSGTSVIADWTFTETEFGGRLTLNSRLASEFGSSVGETWPTVVVELAKRRNPLTFDVVGIELR